MVIVLALYRPERKNQSATVSFPNPHLLGFLTMLVSFAGCDLFAVLMLAVCTRSADVTRRMSKQIGVVGTGGLKDFAANLIGKASKNAAAAAASGAATVAVGTATPDGAHTSVTKAAGAAAPYAGVNTVVVRAVLPEDATGLALRDKVDVFADSGIDNAAEVAAATESFKKSAAVAVAEAKAAGVKKVTALVKQVSKYQHLNAAFEKALGDVCGAAGVEVEVVGSAQATNTLLMFPESLAVVVTADTPTAELVERAFGGAVAGGACRTYYLDGGKTVAGGASPSSVASAVAEAFSAVGLTKEAAAVKAAVAKAKGGDNGAAILAAC